MTAANNILTSVADPDNLDVLKNSLNDQIKNTLENEFLGDYTFKLDDLIKSNEKYINPEEYNKREDVKKKNRWYNIKNQLNPHVEGFIEGNTGSIYEITADGLIARSDYLKTISKDYQDDCQNNINITMKDFLDGSSEFGDGEQSYYENLKNTISSQLKAYKNLYEYKSTMGLLKNGKFNELKNITSKIDTYTQNLYMDSRKNNYENKNYEFYKNIHFYLLIIYYSLFILFLIFSNFIQEQQYYNKKMILYLILYLIFPIILPYILAYLKYLYVYYLEFNNIREEIVSYPDLVNKYYDKIE